MEASATNITKDFCEWAPKLKLWGETPFNYVCFSLPRLYLRKLNTQLVLIYVDFVSFFQEGWGRKIFGIACHKKSMTGIPAF